MNWAGIDAITFGVDDFERCRKFFADWGLQETAPGNFETLNGCEIRLRPKDDPSLPPAIEPGSTPREIVWGVRSEDDLKQLKSATATDPNGLALRFRVSRKRAVAVKGTPTNTWDRHPRVNAASPVYDRARPIEIGHIVMHTERLAETERYYVERLGFIVSDRYPGRGVFLRCASEGWHHDLFLLQPPGAKPGVNHVAFAVRDVHEMIAGGLHISRCGWETQIGPGRHPISSAFFWYVHCPAGGLAEYYADEDWVTPAWKPRDHVPGPEAFAEWAVTGGIDGKTRRQKA
jgi:catechol 2,3-dioxygenase-like lactoylglutathione lyase family enzyme